MAIKYTWREPFTQFAGVKGITAQIVGEEIQRIKDKHGGELIPRYVWQEAKSPRHRLHKCFTNWDVQAAAEAHWDSVARKLIGSIRLVDSENPDAEPSPAFISIKESDGVRFRTLGEVLTSADLQERLLTQAEDELKSFERRYRMLSDICAVIRKARSIIEKRRTKHRGADDERRASA